MKDWEVVTEGHKFILMRKGKTLLLKYVDFNYGELGGDIYLHKLGRKNYLFAGSHNGAQRAAMLYSLLGSCKLNGINPFEWLSDVLAKIPDHPVNKLELLLPNKM